MAKTKAQKKDIINTLTGGFEKAKLIVVSEIKGLPVSDVNKLRSQLRAEKVSHMVAKITLLKRALKKVGINPEPLKLNTQIAVSYGEDDVAAARELKKFATTNQNLKPLCGFLEGEYLDEARLKQLANVPSKMELLGRLASVLSGPNRGLATVLQGNLKGLVRVLSQVKK